MAKVVLVSAPGVSTVLLYFKGVHSAKILNPLLGFNIVMYCFKDMISVMCNLLLPFHIM